MADTFLALSVPNKNDYTLYTQHNCTSLLCCLSFISFFLCKTKWFKSRLVNKTWTFFTSRNPFHSFCGIIFTLNNWVNSVGENSRDRVSSVKLQTLLINEKTQHTRLLLLGYMYTVESSYFVGANFRRLLKYYRFVRT